MTYVDRVSTGGTIDAAGTVITFGGGEPLPEFLPGEQRDRHR
ncbi:MAG: hypothetical protein ACRDTX_08710 [Pseudonocardiaceae bacterium]